MSFLYFIVTAVFMPTLLIVEAKSLKTTLFTLNETNESSKS